MRAFRKFLTAGNSERALAMRSLMALVAAGSLVKLQRYPKLRKRLQSPPTVHKSSARRPSQERVLRILSAVARRLPWATCLVQAIAAQDLLAEYGYAAQLRLGVNRDAAGEFSAHAWLEQDGTVLIGGDASPATFAVLDVAKVRAADLASER